MYEDVKTNSATTHNPVDYSSDRKLLASMRDSFPTPLNRVKFKINSIEEQPI